MFSPSAAIGATEASIAPALMRKIDPECGIDGSNPVVESGVAQDGSFIYVASKKQLTTTSTGIESSVLSRNTFSDVIPDCDITSVTTTWYQKIILLVVTVAPSGGAGSKNSGVLLIVDPLSGGIFQRCHLDFYPTKCVDVPFKTDALLVMASAKGSLYAVSFTAGYKVIGSVGKVKAVKVGKDGDIHKTLFPEELRGEKKQHLYHSDGAVGLLPCACVYPFSFGGHVGNDGGVEVTFLEVVESLGCLAVGYDFGGWLLLNRHTFKPVFSSDHDDVIPGSEVDPTSPVRFVSVGGLQDDSDSFVMVGRGGSSSVNRSEVSVSAYRCSFPTSFPSGANTTSQPPVPVGVSLFYQEKMGDEKGVMYPSLPVSMLDSSVVGRDIALAASLMSGHHVDTSFLCPSPEDRMSLPPRGSFPRTEAVSFMVLTYDCSGGDQGAVTREVICLDNVIRSISGDAPHGPLYLPIKGMNCSYSGVRHVIGSHICDLTPAPKCPLFIGWVPNSDERRDTMGAPGDDALVALESYPVPSLAPSFTLRSIEILDSGAVNLTATRVPGQMMAAIEEASSEIDGDLSPREVVEILQRRVKNLVEAEVIPRVAVEAALPTSRDSPVDPALIDLTAELTSDTIIKGARASEIVAAFSSAMVSFSRSEVVCGLVMRSVGASPSSSSVLANPALLFEWARGHLRACARILAGASDELFREDLDYNKVEQSSRMVVAVKNCCQGAEAITNALATRNGVSGTAEGGDALAALSDHLSTLTHACKTLLWALAVGLVPLDETDVGKLMGHDVETTCFAMKNHASELRESLRVEVARNPLLSTQAANSSLFLDGLWHVMADDRGRSCEALNLRGRGRLLKDEEMREDMSEDAGYPCGGWESPLSPERGEIGGEYAPPSWEAMLALHAFSSPAVRDGAARLMYYHLVLYVALEELNRCNVLKLPSSSHPLLRSFSATFSMSHSETSCTLALFSLDFNVDCPGAVSLLHSPGVSPSRPLDLVSRVALRNPRLARSLLDHFYISGHPILSPSLSAPDSLACAQLVVGVYLLGGAVGKALEVVREVVNGGNDGSEGYSADVVRVLLHTLFSQCVAGPAPLLEELLLHALSPLEVQSLLEFLWAENSERSHHILVSYLISCERVVDASLVHAASLSLRPHTANDPKVLTRASIVAAKVSLLPPAEQTRARGRASRVSVLAKVHSGGIGAGWAESLGNNNSSSSRHSPLSSRFGPIRRSQRHAPRAPRVPQAPTSEDMGVSEGRDPINVGVLPVSVGLDTFMAAGTTTTTNSSPFPLPRIQSPAFPSRKVVTSNVNSAPHGAGETFLFPWSGGVSSPSKMFPADPHVPPPTAATANAFGPAAMQMSPETVAAALLQCERLEAEISEVRAMHSPTPETISAARQRSISVALAIQASPEMAASRPEAAMVAQEQLAAMAVVETEGDKKNPMWSPRHQTRTSEPPIPLSPVSPFRSSASPQRPQKGEEEEEVIAEEEEAIVEEEQVIVEEVVEEEPMQATNLFGSNTKSKGAVPKTPSRLSVTSTTAVMVGKEDEEDEGMMGDMDDPSMDLEPSCPISPPAPLHHHGPALSAANVAAHKAFSSGVNADIMGNMSSPSRRSIRRKMNGVGGLSYAVSPLAPMKCHLDQTTTPSRRSENGSFLFSPSPARFGGIRDSPGSDTAMSGSPAPGNRRFQVPARTPARLLARSNRPVAGGLTVSPGPGSDSPQAAQDYRDRATLPLHVRRS